MVCYTWVEYTHLLGLTVSNHGKASRLHADGIGFNGHLALCKTAKKAVTSE